jgi:hypothetical protein
MSWWPGSDRDPSGGERLDELGHTTVSLAFKALERFPALMKRHKYIAGGAAISGSLIALASVAVARRMRQGASAEEAVNSVTEEELSGLHLVSDRPRPVAEDSSEATESDDAATNGSSLPEDLDDEPVPESSDELDSTPEGEIKRLSGSD